MTDAKPLSPEERANHQRDTDHRLARALATIRAHQPDVVVLDLLMPDGDGLSLLRKMNAEGLSPRVVMLTGAPDDEMLLEALRLGVHGLVLKDMAPALLLQCVRTVAAGGQWLERGLASRVLATVLRKERGAQVATTLGLSTRELEIVRFVADGLRNRAIADELNITEGTVKVHLHNIYEKLGVESRLALTEYARNRRLI